MELARQVRLDLADKLQFDETAAIRQEIAQIIPQYAGIQHLKEAGNQFQYGGSHLCFGWNFPTPDGKAHFSVLSPPKQELPEGYFLVTTRRGKQFNSMVQEKKDAITGAVREAVLMSREDISKLGLKEGDGVILKNDFGELKGHVYTAPMKPGNLQVHWPEGNVLLDTNKRSPEVDIPNYNALVCLEKVEG
nr:MULTISPECIES: molybdopterin dinucleotide binding domain-containing protein [unclassified Coleofasciculus]